MARAFFIFLLFLFNESEFNTVSLSCSYCGMTINRKINNVRKVIMRRDPKLFFCDKHCQGKYIVRVNTLGIIMILVNRDRNLFLV
jgi:hypothetical protein